MSTRRTAAVAGVVVTAISVAGCSRLPEHHGDACSVDGDLVAAVLDTSRYEVAGDDARLPLDGDDAAVGSSGSWGCTVSTDGDDRLSVGVELITELKRDDIQAVVVNFSDHRFSAGTGAGIVYPRDDERPDRFRAVWSCGRIGGEVNGSVSGWEESDVAGLAHAVAGAAGCWEPASASSTTGSAAG